MLKCIMLHLNSTLFEAHFNCVESTGNQVSDGKKIIEQVNRQPYAYWNSLVLKFTVYNRTEDLEPKGVGQSFFIFKQKIIQCNQFPLVICKYQH